MRDAVWIFVASLLTLYLLLGGALPSLDTIELCATFAVLVIASTLFQSSGVLPFMASYFSQKFSCRRCLALTLILSVGLFSAVTTNDACLLFAVPFTLALRNALDRYTSRVIALEAIAANCGSTLTPIGNPQNLYIWHTTGVSFLSFVLRMFPLWLALLALVSLFVWLFIPKERYLHVRPSYKIDRRKLFWAIFLAILAITFSHSSYVLVLFVLALFTLLFTGENIQHPDWALVCLVASFFLFFSYVGRLFPPLPSHMYTYSVALSQLISNVPAAIVLQRKMWIAPLVYGVNVGANGTFWASLANVIAVRIGGWNVAREYLRMSIPFLLVSFLIGWLLLALTVL